MSRLVQLKKDARFAAGLARRQPFNCLIQITNRCNLTCSFCDFWPNPAPKHEELSVAELERLGDELHDLGTFLISIEGGEPFVRADIFDVVRVLSKHHITSIFTSGWFMTAEHARRAWDAEANRCPQAPTASVASAEPSMVSVAMTPTCSVPRPSDSR